MFTSTRKHFRFLKKYLLLAWIICSQCINAFGQYTDRPYPSCVFTNPNLIEQLKAGVIKDVELWATQSSYGIMASSTLRPAGSDQIEKTFKKSDYPDKDVAEIELQGAKEDWACQYSAYNLSDGDPTTAWIEGVEGDGIGEVVIAGYREIDKPLKIWAGYGKSDALFKANNRPRRVRVYLLGTNCPLAAVSTVLYKPFKVAGAKEIVLKDLNGFQTLELPTITKPVPAEECEYEDGKKIIYWVAIEILSVYKGTRYSDTCISEIK